MTTSDTAWLVYLLCALVLVGGGVVAARTRAKAVDAKGPGVFASLLIWAGILCVVALLAQASAVWAALGSLFS